MSTLAVSTALALLLGGCGSESEPVGRNESAGGSAEREAEARQLADGGASQSRSDDTARLDDRPAQPPGPSETLIEISPVPEKSAAHEHINQLAAPVSLVPRDVLRIVLGEEVEEVRLQFFEHSTVEWIGVLQRRMEPAVSLTNEAPQRLVEALMLDEGQAAVISRYVRKPTTRMSDLWTMPIRAMAQDEAAGGRRVDPVEPPRALTFAQMDAILSRGSLRSRPGRLAPATIAMMPNALMERYDILTEQGREAVGQLRTSGRRRVETFSDVLGIGARLSSEHHVRFIEFAHEQCLVVIVRRDDDAQPENDLALLLVFDEPLKRRESVYLLD